MPTTCPSDRRAEGQIGDVIRPIEERRDCSGVITQLAAFPSTRPRPIHDHRERVATVHQRRRHGDTESGATGDAVPLIGLQHVLVDRDKVRGLARAAETEPSGSRECGHCHADGCRRYEQWPLASPVPADARGGRRFGVGRRHFWRFAHCGVVSMGSGRATRGVALIRGATRPRPCLLVDLGVVRPLHKPGFNFRTVGSWSSSRGTAGTRLTMPRQAPGASRRTSGSPCRVR